MNIKRFIVCIIANLYYPIFKKKHIKILSIDETIEFMKIKGNSIVRFGDGEFSILNGKDIENYQYNNEILRTKMEECISTYNYNNVLLCLPETLTSLEICNSTSKKNWKLDFFLNRKVYMKYCMTDYVYGNAFVSRPYLLYKDKKNSERWIKSILSLFNKKDIVIIEGSLSRTGVGNNLFKNATSVKRIICPSQNAFSKYDEIIEAAFNIDKECLILLAIGPTSKPVAFELIKAGYWVYDIGHIDSEYEWYLRGVTSKERILGKHTAEGLDDNISECKDREYIESIICKI